MIKMMILELLKLIPMEIKINKFLLKLTFFVILLLTIQACVSIF